MAREIKYLIVGGVNTVFGYFVGVGTYTLLSPMTNIFVIGFVSNLFAITFSFLCYKIFVFKTSGYWLQEYFKACFVYGGMAVFGIVLLWICVDVLKISIWLTQGLVIIATAILSYIGHSHITFKRKFRNI